MATVLYAGSSGFFAMAKSLSAINIWAQYTALRASTLRWSASWCGSYLVTPTLGLTGVEAVSRAL